jgi:hypothetical protein
VNLLKTGLDAKLNKNAPIVSGTYTKISYSSTGLITSGINATTADIADSLDKRYVTDTQKVVIGNTSGSNTGDETSTTIKSKLGISTLSGSNTGDETNSSIKTKLGPASISASGYLTSSGYILFNSKQAALGYTPENVSNKENSTIDISTTKYPTVNLLKTGLDAKLNKNSSIVGATHTKVTYSSTGLILSGSNATTADISDSTNKRYVTDSNLIVIGNTSNTNTGDQTLSGLGGVAANATIVSGTHTKISYDTKGLVTSGTDATTSDISDSTNKRYVTDSNLIVIGNTSGSNSGDETTSTIKTKLGPASASASGYLTSSGFITFSNKQNALGFTPENITNKSTNTSLGNSNTLYPTQNAVKSYIDNKVGAAIRLQADWDAISNIPNISATTSTGFAWRVSVAGSTNLGGIVSWKIGDLAVKSAVSWIKIDNQDIAAVWGNISGSIINQTDLSNALFAKANLSGAIFTGSISATNLSGTNTGDETTSTIKTKLGVSSSTADGYLTSTGYRLFDNKPNYLQAGIVTEMVVTDRGSGLVDISSCVVNLYSTPDFVGPIIQYTIPALIGLQLVANQYTYISINYNSGSPHYAAITDNTTINHSTILNGVQLNWEFLGVINETHIFYTGTYGLGLANKIAHRLIHTQRFGYQSGLAISEYGTRNVLVNSGVIWYDGEEVDLSLSQSATAGSELHFYYHVGGIWTAVKSATYNNTQYDNGSALSTLNNGRYAVNWLYRCVSSTDPYVFVVLGSGNYTLAQAQSSQPPVLPLIINNQGVLIGRIIVLKNSNTSTQIDSSFQVSFTPSAVAIHNDLAGLQGGTIDEYYHVSNAEYIVIGNTSGTNTGDNSANSNSGLVHTSGDETISGIKTFNSFPVTPSSAPTTDYQTANKKYVDDSISNENLWDRSTIDVTPHTAGDNINLGSGGFKDSNVITAVKLGSPIDTALNTTKKNILGGINETYRGLLNIESTGLVTGGVLSVNATDHTKYNLTAGTALIVDNHTDSLNPTKTLVSWGNLTSQVDPLLATDATTYIAIDATGTFHFKNDSYSPGERRLYADIGWLDHPSLTTIEEVKIQPEVIFDLSAQLNDFMLNFGPFNIDGNEYSAASGLHIQRTEGATFDANANYWHDKTSPHVTTTGAESPVDFFYYYRILAGDGWRNDLPETSFIDPNHWDDGTGVLATVPSGKWTIQVISFYSQTNENDIQYGQVVYDSYAEARTAMQDPIEINPYNVTDTFRAWLIVQEGCTDLTNVATAVFKSAGRLGMSSVQSGGGIGGEVNTASNDIAGIGTGQLFGSKVGVDLVFKKIASGSSKLTINNGTHDITLDVVVTKSDVGLSAVTNDAQVKKISSSTIGNLTSWASSTGNLPADSGISATSVSSHISSTSNPHSTSDANLNFTDITTNNFSATKHGFVPKGTNVGHFLKDDGTWAVAGTGSGTVVGPVSSTNNHVVFFNGSTGALIKDSGLTLAGSNTGDQHADGITITGTGTILDPFISIGGGGESNTASNSVSGVGTGLIFKNKVGVDLVFKKIKSGATGNIVITNGTDDITLETIISDTTLSLSDITTNNFSATKHGFVPKGTNVGKFLKDNGTWAVPAGGGRSASIPNWFSSTGYILNDTVVDPSSKFIYRATTSFTSSATLAADIIANNFQLIGGSGSGGANYGYFPSGWG